ncbi:MAG: hypothetical protein Kilf2KO_37830 [Rhodospirillales bacterium]
MTLLLDRRGRRRLLRGVLATAALGASGLLAGRPASAFDLRSGSGSDRPHEDLGPGARGRLSKMLFRGEGNRQFGLSSLLVLADEGAWYADFSRRVVQRDEDRVGILRDVPLLGQFFAPTLRARDFSESRQIGLAFQLDETLLIDLHRSGQSRQQLAEAIMAGTDRPGTLALAGSAKPVQTVGAANQKISYFLLGGPSPVNPEQPPKPLRQLAGGAQAQQIGRAYNNGETLLVLVRPSILTGWS